MIQLVTGHFDELSAPLRRLVDDLPAEAGGAFEHDPRWLSVLAEALGHRTMALVARGGTASVGGAGAGEGAAGEIEGYLPLALVTSRLFGRFLVSLPYLNRGGIVARDEATRAALLEAAVELAERHRVQYLELRHHAQATMHDAITQNRDDKALMLLNLPADADGLWKAVNGKVRNLVRKGDKSALTLCWGGMDRLDEFYDVFSVNMRDLGTPVYPRRLFEAILRRFPSEAELAVVRHEGRAVAGALLIHQPNGLTQVPSASSLRAFGFTSANMWMYHRLLLRSIERGSGVFDFGRSSEGSGTWRFKKQWGAIPQTTTWQYHVRWGEVGMMRPEHPKMQRRVAAWQKLPVWVTRMVGPTIVRGIP